MKYIFDEIFKKLEDQVKGHSADLSFGGAKDFPAYCERVGVISGIRTSMNEVQDVWEMLKKQEEEDE